MQKDRVTIACISPYVGLNGMGAYMDRTYGVYFLRSCAKGEPSTTLVIEDATDYKKIVIDLVTPPEYVPITIYAKEIAEDFCQYINIAGEHLFVCKGDVPTKQELEQAQISRHAWLVKAIGFGDSVFGRLGNRGIEQIPDYCKRAVVELGETRDWVFQPSVAKTECEGCGNSVSLLKDGSKPAVCRGCGAIMDVEKYARLFPSKVEPEPAPALVSKSGSKSSQ